MKQTSLKTWLLTKPIMFSLVLFGLITASSVIFSLIQTFLNFDNPFLLYGLIVLSFIASIWFTIKKLPHDTMYRKDFVAIVNGAYLISMTLSLATMIIIYFYGAQIQHQIMPMYIFHPLQFAIIVALFTLLTLYSVGVSISNIYAKYKRCRAIGISAWKIILSIPFGFLMLWAPGYVNDDKIKKTNIAIKSKWFAKFNNWVFSSFANTLFIFLTLVVTKTVITGFTALILFAFLLGIYLIWNIKHKEDFMNAINRGYATAAVFINLAIIIPIFIGYIVK